MNRAPHPDDAAEREAQDICDRWANRLGYGFHPDTRAEDYRPALTHAHRAVYESDMERLFALPIADPYEFAVAALKAWEKRR